MAEGFSPPKPAAAPRVWAVGSLVRAIADTLAERFNLVAVRGEISGFSRATSGHCYFSLKDDTGQVRCAMFRRSADQLNFAPRDGQVVEAIGRLDVYGPRGDLQLIVEALKPAGQGALYEQFLRLKAQLESEGLFDGGRKRVLPAQPTSIGVVTSLGAAALRDVVSTLRRRVPHIPVVIYPAAVQGAAAAGELCAALRTAYQRHAKLGESEVLLLVRGGGSLEDLWCFNDEALVRLLAQAPMPVVSGVGHESDFTLADFVADLRAPTPTAAAELCAPTQASRLDELAAWAQSLADAALGGIDQRAQRLDRLAQRLGRPSGRVHESRQRLMALGHGMERGLSLGVQQRRHQLDSLGQALPVALGRAMERQRQRLSQSAAVLKSLDPQSVLERGFAMITDADGAVVTRVAQVRVGDALSARLADGAVEMNAAAIRQ